MRMKRLFRVLALSFALVGFGCGDSSGGEVTSEAQFQGVMEGIALDFAQLLSDVAPDSEVFFAVKGTDVSATDCPDGGSASWDAASGALALSACSISGVTLTGSMFGSIFQDVMPELQQLSVNLAGELMVSGRAMADLSVQQLIVSASAIPIEEESTFWRIEAVTEGGDGELVCAWSEGGPCEEDPFDF